jgi:diguanylate cyclase (GGDEF)-like protein/PAS domain S-box-containing protein
MTDLQALPDAPPSGLGGGPPAEGSVTLHVDRAELERALGDGRLVTAFQPTVRVSDGVVDGLEALARLRLADGGVVLPGAFIPVAEESGLITEIDRQVMLMACRQMAQLEQHPHLAPSMRCWVNLSAGQLQHPDRVRDMVTAALFETGCAPRRLGVEVTESSLVADLDAAAEALGSLRALGVRVALDDFGTGYSSLSYLRNLPLDVVKIDRSFVAGVDASISDAAIIEAVCDLSHAFDLSVVAEGVERLEQLHRLVALGIDRAQGFLVSRAVDWSVVVERVGTPWFGADVRGVGDESPSWRDSPRSQLLLRALDAAPLSVMIHDDHAIEYVNRAFEEETGHRATDLVGRSPEVVRATSRGGWARHADGHEYPVEETEAAIVSPNGGVHRITLRSDITVQESLRRAVELQRACQEIAARFAHDCLAQPLSTPLVAFEPLDRICTEVAAVLDVPHVFFDLVDHSTRTVSSIAGHRGGAAIPQPSEALSLGQMERQMVQLVEHGALWWSGDGEVPAWVEDSCTTFSCEPSAELRVALLVRGEVCGIIGLKLPPGMIRHWQPVEVDFLTSIAASAAALDERHRTHAMSSVLVEAANAVLRAPREQLTGRLDQLLRRVALLVRVDVAFIDGIHPEASGTTRHYVPIAGGSAYDIPTTFPSVVTRSTDPYFVRLALMEPVVVRDTLTPPDSWYGDEHPLTPLGTEWHPRATLLVPIEVEGRLGGLIGLASARRARAWSPSEIETLSTLGSIVAAAIDHERTGMRLRESEEMYRTLAETSTDVIITTDEHGVVTYISPSVHEVLGREPAELLGTRLVSLVHPDDEQVIVHGEHELRAGRRALVEVRILHPDERWVWVQSASRLAQRADAGIELHISLRDVSHQRSLRDQLDRQAHTDALTGLENRTSFQASLDAAVARMETTSALVMLDLDGFKPVNDGHGHSVGDTVLREVGRRLASVARSWPDGSVLVARWGGDEFAVLHQGAGIDGSVELVEALIAAVSDPIETPVGSVAVGASAGVAPLAGYTSGDALLAADQALYQAKREQRGTYRVRTNMRRS